MHETLHQKRKDKKQNQDGIIGILRKQNLSPNPNHVDMGYVKGAKLKELSMNKKRKVKQS
jgi:hypothetical protein